MIIKLFTYFKILSISLISYQVVDYFYDDFTTNVKIAVIESKTLEDKRVSLKEDEKFNTLNHYSAISKRNLFNISGKTSNIDNSIDLSSIKKSTGTLKLWGTITGLGSGDTAIIEDTVTRKQDLYHVDDTVQNARIVRILRNKVIISVNGNEEILEVSDSVETFTPKITKPVVQSEKALKRSFKVRKSMVDNALTNLNNLSKEIRIRPYYKNGEPAGIRIRRLSNISFFSRIGLRTGDVIKSVQGIEIKSMADAATIQNAINGSKTINVAIERLGKPFNFEYNIEN